MALAGQVAMRTGVSHTSVLRLCAYRGGYLHPLFSIPHGVLVLQRMARLKSASSWLVLFKSAAVPSKCMGISVSTERN